MTIIYRDDIGYVSVEVAPSEITFCNGQAWFTGADGKEYTVDINAIAGIEGN